MYKEPSLAWKGTTEKLVLQKTL